MIAELAANSSPITSSAPAQALPAPRVPISIRPGVMSDVPFMDSLQKIHTRQVGWMPTKQFEGKINAGHVLVAEAIVDCGLSSVEKTGRDALRPSTFDIRPSPTPVGYCIGNDQYFKRDDVGIIYQLNVLPGRQRGLIGASLLKAMFDRAAYGCKLYCCWCAQDIAANHFWEAMGFFPLAYRAGGKVKKSKDEGGRACPEYVEGMKDEKGRIASEYSPFSSFIPHPSSLSCRVHIFWQKRIRSGDASTPWWYPSQTGGGSIREDRLVLPIPPGTHWSEAKPILLPQGEAGLRTEDLGLGDKPKKVLRGPKSSTKSLALSPKSLRKPAGLWFAPPQPIETAKEKPKRKKTPKQKNDPRLIAAARELRDRWLEEINSGRSLIGQHGKYEISRVIGQETTHHSSLVAHPLLPAA